MDISEEFYNCKSDYTLHTNKKIKTTRKLQELAAELMTVNDKTNALKLYNRSIAVSPVNAIDLPIAFANKSAVLLEMKNYDACMNNINLALKHPMCPVWLVSALLERKVKCLILMSRWSENTAKVLLNFVKILIIVLTLIVNDKTTAVYQPRKNLLKIRLNQYLLHLYNTIKNTEEISKDNAEGFIQNYKRYKKKFGLSENNVLCISNNIEIVQNKTYGRHIITKNNINSGELLLKEKAIISCLYLNEVYDYCSCCQIRTHVLIPCNQCTRALFCSKYCLIRAMELYHHIECPLMEYFAEIEPEDQHIQYITRLICFLSNQGKKLTELIEKWRKTKDEEKNYTLDNNIYVMPRNFQTLFLSFDKYAYMPLQFAHSQSRYTQLVEKLKEKTDFFSHLSTDVNDHYFQYLVTSLLIDLEAYFKCNSFCISDIMRSNDDSVAVIRKNVGLACFREANFFNHSCVPNAAYCFENGDTISIYSLQKIRPGEQIFICYLNTYYEVDKSKRDLMKNYSFQCRCVACLGNWPPSKNCSRYMIGCRYCRFKRDVAISLKNIREKLISEQSFHQIAENLKLEVAEAMDLFQNLEGIEIFLIKEYVELYRLYCRCIEIPKNINTK
ncbi:hypothetical protein PGB90_005296 [Kerria lacca]